jgi:hypothetical protein
MKVSMVIALPALALAAASPVQVEERQLPGLDLTCLSKITGLTTCVTAPPDLTNISFITQLFSW